MAKIIKLEHPFEIEAEKFMEFVRKGEITHAVMCYRLTEGFIGYTYLGGEHKTYLIGLLQRTIHRLETIADEEGEFENV